MGELEGVQIPGGGPGPPSTVGVRNRNSTPLKAQIDGAEVITEHRTFPSPDCCPTVVAAGAAE